MDTMPRTIGPWNIISIQEYPAPFGFSAGYVLDDTTTATIYFYNAGLTWIPPGVNSRPVRDQFAQAKQGILQAESLGTWKHVQNIADDSINLGDGEDALPALRSTFILEDRQGQETYSQIVLTSAKNIFAKVRLSFHEVGDEEWQNAISLLFKWIQLMLQA